MSITNSKTSGSANLTLVTTVGITDSGMVTPQLSGIFRPIFISPTWAWFGLPGYKRISY